MYLIFTHTQTHAPDHCYSFCAVRKTYRENNHPLTHHPISTRIDRQTQTQRPNTYPTRPIAHRPHNMPTQDTRNNYTAHQPFTTLTTNFLNKSNTPIRQQPFTSQPIPANEPTPHPLAFHQTHTQHTSRSSSPPDNTRPNLRNASVP